MEQQIISIGTLTKIIKNRLESDGALQDVWVQGEISNFTHHASGHMYYTLKDSMSKVKCIMFARANQKLGFAPKEGMKVLARGSVSVYDKDGNVQFYVTEMQPDGLGSLYLAFEQLKRQLESEGLFSSDRKRPIPVLPRVVGVITSPTGAAVRDIMTTLKRRFPAIPVLLIPALVQGDGAAPSIVRAIQLMNRVPNVDTIIVGRGGGSLEELWAFNEESVARAIAASRIPVISAVGHETDFTIADFVADLRAPTPTAAAELAVPSRVDKIAQLNHFEMRMTNGLKALVRMGRNRLEVAKKNALFANPFKLLEQPAQKVDRLGEALIRAMERKVQRTKENWQGQTNRLERANPRHLVTRFRDRQLHLDERLRKAVERTTTLKANKFTILIRQLDALSPLKVMSRGYSLTYDEGGKELIKSVNQVRTGDAIQVRLADGSLHCHIAEIKGE
jgi:exodeoxyribonuclease VII large subunit